MSDEQRRKLHKLILEFAMYSRISIPKQIANTRMVLASFPKDIGNQPLCWLLTTSVKGALEGLLNDLVQALDLIRKTAKDLGEPIAITDEMADVKRMRDTLLAHRMEVSISTEEHLQWYKKKYGSFEKVFWPVETVAAQLGDLAWQLSQHKKFQKSQASISQPILLRRKDIDTMLQALKTSNAY